VVLSDVPIAKTAEVGAMGGLTQKVQEQLLDAVRERGAGILATGGPFGFAPEYAGTPISRMLPVEIDSQGDVEDPPVAMAIMLDRSGPMAAQAGSGTHTKIQLATEAALAAADALRPDDQLALGSVDEKTTWNLPLSPIKKLDGARERIRAIDA